MGVIESKSAFLGLGYGLNFFADGVKPRGLRASRGQGAASSKQEAWNREHGALQKHSLITLSALPFALCIFVSL